jgi:hypothetical protein
MTTRLSFSLNLPKQTTGYAAPIAGDPPRAPIPNAGANSTTTSALNNTQKTSGFFEDFSLIQKIKAIWNQIIEAVISCFTQVTELFDTSYPTVNLDLSKQNLKKIYWRLGNEKWRECIDGCHQDKGKFVYDRGLHGGPIEPGFINSMENAHRFVELSLGNRIDADWYLRLHKQTAGHFRGALNGTVMDQDKVGIFRDVDLFTFCSLTGHYAITPEGLAEFEALDLEIKREFGPSYGLGKIVFTDESRKTARLSYTQMTSTQVRQIFNKFLNEYYSEIDKAQTPDQKLWAIAKVHQRMEWLHPVRDGTARTTRAMSDKFLTENGFHPAILKYPHRSTTYGLKDWKQYLQKGLIEWEKYPSSN